MRIFVAGGTGVIGRSLVPQLVAAGHEVTVATRRADRLPGLREQGARGVVADMLDRDAVAAALALAAPETVIHQLTALSDGTPADNARIRREGTRNLVDAAMKAGAERFIAQSISWAYQGGDGPAGEDTPLDLAAPEPRATTIGGVAALEDAVTQAGFGRYVILRYGMFYGPGTWYAPGGLMAGKLAAGELPAGDAVSSFVHVSDAAEAAVLALGWPSGPVNVVDDEPAPAREWVPALAAALDRPAPAPVPGRAAWERGASNARARTLGWLPFHRTWRTGFHSVG